MKTKLFQKALNTPLSKSIETIIDLAIPKDSKNKILLIPIVYEADYYTRKSELHERKEIIIVAQRQHNYCFVGYIPENDSVNVFNISNETELKMVSFHDSCWRSGVETIIRKFAQEFIHELEDKDWEVETNFNVIQSPRIIQGMVYLTEEDGRVAKFNIDK